MSTQGERQVGKKSSVRKASLDRHIQFYDFLLFDPAYRKMSERAKLLYTFLRSKVSSFAMGQERFETGERTQSYQDEEGNIFIIADDFELAYILNISESALDKTKKELAKFGLLLEEQVKGEENRLYVLEPANLSD